MNNSPAKKYLLIGGCIAAVLLAWFAIVQISNAVTFRVVGTNPSTRRISTTAPFFKINFNRPIKSRGVKVQSSAAGLFATYSVSGKTLTIPFEKQLDKDTTYTISLHQIFSTDGKKISDVKFVFKPRYIPSSSLPDDQRNALLEKENIGGIDVNNPIVKHLPYHTTDFLLDQSGTPQNNQTKFPVDATLYLKISDVSDDQAKQAAIATYKQEVADYIHSIGLDPDSYAINYLVANP